MNFIRNLPYPNPAPYHVPYEKYIKADKKIAPLLFLQHLILVSVLMTTLLIAVCLYIGAACTNQTTFGERCHGLEMSLPQMLTLKIQPSTRTSSFLISRAASLTVMKLCNNKDQEQIYLLGLV